MDTADNISLTITTESLRLLLNMNVPIPTWCMAPIPITPELEEMMRSKVGGRLAQTCRSLRDEAGHHDLRAVWQKVVGEAEGDSPSRRGRVRAGAGLAGGAAAAGVASPLPRVGSAAPVRATKAVPCPTNLEYLK